MIPLRVEQIHRGKCGVDKWKLSGNPAAPPMRLSKGRRRRLIFDNRTDDPHPLHLHRHMFELINAFGRQTSRLEKDVVLIKRREKMEVDVIPIQTGLALFHRHQQLHTDQKFKLLFDVAQ